MGLVLLHFHRYVQLAVSRQPGYRQGNLLISLGATYAMHRNIRSRVQMFHNKWNSGHRIIETRRGALRAKSIKWHAAGYESKLIRIEACEQSLMQFHQRAAEHELVKGRKTNVFHGLGCWASIPSPVFATGGKPSTRLPPGRLVEQLGCTKRHIQQRQKQNPDAS